MHQIGANLEIRAYLAGLFSLTQRKDRMKAVTSSFSASWSR